MGEGMHGEDVVDAGREEADAARLRERVRAIVERVPPDPVDRRRGARRGPGARHQRRLGGERRKGSSTLGLVAAD